MLRFISPEHGCDLIAAISFGVPIDMITFKNGFDLAVSRLCYLITSIVTNFFRVTIYVAYASLRIYGVRYDSA